MTDAAAILAVVAAILNRLADRPLPALALSTPLDALDGIDSLRLLETVALAEEHFAVQVDLGGLDGLATVGDIVRLIHQAAAR